MPLQLSTPNAQIITDPRPLSLLASEYGLVADLFRSYNCRCNRIVTIRNFSSAVG